MLKRFFQFFLSVKLASLLLLVFAAVIGVATFIENDFGRVTAKALIYSKWWFELILFMLLINLIYNLTSWYCKAINGKANPILRQNQNCKGT